ncbi:uncharacterized, partial [Tachysurus ichikawai]
MDLWAVFVMEQSNPAHGTTKLYPSYKNGFGTVH